ncbi:aflYc/ glcA/ glucosidase [Ascosphaera apis ARSEF 7405]|uniref:AflYc/ glcA/ glucosidase n=1 Tax=Ascosphaera apis ARSEF 7405 TaxID=392613 RepID=A0A162IC35_9EURO|nr:aflYc/ glcA/ glucosidase [Ascosphaera apis ARSEF 7405]
MVAPNKVAAHRSWWKEQSVYQIYPASFKDTNGDGVGDIPGIISELDYLKNLGVDIVWLSPILESPQVDMGYDISNYYDIHPPYGTMQDVETMIKGLHDRGMKYVMDLVVNHTSNQHHWFQESRKSLDNPYRDFYIWKKPRYDENGNPHPPNNWKSHFSGPAWQLDPLTNEYYLCLFAPQQCDLNWENPKVREEVHKIMRFWLDKGVDGFRMDVINFISKRPGLPDARDPPLHPSSFLGAEHYANGPRVHEYLQGIGKIMKEYDAFSVGEMPFVYDEQEVLMSVGATRGELNMIFQFDIVESDHGNGGKFTDGHWTLTKFKKIVNRWQTFMCENGGWNALFLENHDQGRSISRFASDKPEFRTLSAKMLATFLALQCGTPFVYQGQELAQIRLDDNWGIEKFQDIEIVNYWKELTEKHGDDKKRLNDVLREMRLKSRDGGRTPMQWNDKPNAGFTTPNTKPWISLHDDYKEWNAANAVADPNSAYHHWGKVLNLRKEFVNIFVYGMFAMYDEASEEVFAYTRDYDENNRGLVVCSFKDYEISWTIPEALLDLVSKGKVVLNNYPEDTIKDGKIILKPFQALVIVQTA